MSLIGSWMNSKRRGKPRRRMPHETVGFKIRSKMGAIEKKLGPVLVKLFPSFIYTHYAYVTFLAILGSILIYPQKNISYIDALFLASGSLTQAGLNTVDINNLTLYQQIVIYISCFISTPIFIHGGILLVRLYWFERYFDGIKESSKLNHKMRRTATLLAINSLQTNDRFTRLNAHGKTGFTSSTDFYPGNTMYDEEAAIQGSPSTKEEASSDSELTHGPNNIPITRRVISRVDTDERGGTDHDQQPDYNNVVHMSEPSDSEEEAGRYGRDMSPDYRLEQNDDRDIKFAENLPQPDRRKKEIEPQDMYRSIAMMQNNHKLQHPDNDNDEEGPALVISGPLEREARKKKKKKRLSSRKPRIKKFRYDRNVDEDLDEVETEKPARRMSMLQFKVPVGASINRLKGGTNTPWGRNQPNESALTDNEDEEDDEEEESDDEDIEENRTDSDEEEYPLSKAQTHLVIPSSDQTNGVKYSKRANTLDVNPMRRPSMLGKSPTIDKIFKSRAKKHHNRRRRRLDEEEDDDDEEEIGLSKYTSRNAVSGNYLSWTPTVARNSTFVALTDDQKEELGGVEYRAVKLLSKIVVLYYVVFHIIAILCYLPFIVTRDNYIKVLREDGFSPAWWGFFTPASCFNDLGYTLTPDSMTPFYKNAYILLVSGFFIIIGNTGFPIFLRFIIWVLFKFAKQLSLFKESLGFLLDHPRRCFTLLFPSVPTWWLFFILVALNAVDLVLFIILDLNNDSLTSIPVGYRILDGLFQAFSTRTAGFAVVNLADLHPSVQVSYMLMMYISVLPLAISIRRTNVYEEQSLGVYGGNDKDDDPEKTPKTFVATHLRNQLSFDLWFIFLGLFIICIADGSKLEKNNPDFSVFQILFEIVSAYGTVGLSLGFPNTNTSFSAQFSVISKLVIIAMMIRGRHRGLPYALDRAIILPSEKLKRIDKMQEKYGHSSLSRMGSVATTDSRSRTNIFDRVKTLRAGLFSVGTVDHANWLDNRMPTASKRQRAPSHQPENITFSLAGNNNSNSSSHHYNNEKVESDHELSPNHSGNIGSINSDSIASDQSVSRITSQPHDEDSTPITARRAVVTRHESF